MNVSPTWTDTGQFAVLAGQLVVLVVAAIVAGRQVREARELREQQIRPFVVIDFEVEGFLFYLAVSNIGNTLARDVRFHINPPFSTAINERVADLKMFREGIPTLAPGKKIRTMFDSGIQRKPDQFPDVYQVRIEYFDQKRKRHFEEDLELDLGIYWNLITADQRDIHDIHERLKEIRDVFKKWTTNTGAILRVSPDERRAENERLLQEREERRAARERAAQEESDESEQS